VVDYGADEKRAWEELGCGDDPWDNWETEANNDEEGGPTMVPEYNCNGSPNARSLWRRTSHAQNTGAPTETELQYAFRASSGAASSSTT